jgi:hypothetical protein
MAKSVKRSTPSKKLPSASKTGKPKPGAVIAAVKKAITPSGKKKTDKLVLYVDSSFFFPLDSDFGYTDDFQAGRYTKRADQMLQAPILLPVGAKIFTITMYYKNTTTEPMLFIYLKKHIDHHAFSGEVEVSFESLPQGMLAPDNFLGKVVNHFENAGVIKDKYLYFLQVQSTGKTDEKIMKTVRGMRIEYQL